MIFKTFDSDVDNMSSKWGMFGKSFSDISNSISTKWKQVNDYIAVTNDATISGIANAWKGSKPLEFLETSQVESILGKYNKALDQGAESTAKFIDAGTGNDFMNGFLKDLNGAPATMDKYNTAVKSAEMAQNGLTASMVASKVAAMAMNVAISMGVSIAISALVKVVDNLVHANEKAIESADELRKKYEDFKETNASNVSTLKELKDEFNTLSKGVSQYGDNISLTTDEYTRYKEIVQQIVGMSPSLSEGYSTENGYIADKNGLLERAIELQDQEYKNELRKITNLDNLKTSMSGYIAEYKEAFNGGLVTDDGSATATREFTDMQNAIYDLFNTNNRSDFSSEDMVKQIMSSLGIEDIDKEIAKYYNEYGYFQSSDFWNDYADTIAENIQVIDDALSADSVGLDSTVFDQNIIKVESCAQSYNDMKDSISLANESIQTDLGYIAEYVDEYSDLTTAQQKFVSDYLKGYDISDITSTDSFGNLVYDEDKMATVKSQIVKFVEELSKDTTTKDALENLYAPPTDDESVSEYVDRIKTAITAIQTYCTENGIEIPIALGDISTDTDDLSKKYENAIKSAQDKFGTDETKFFKDNSINTTEEIDNWLSVAEAANNAAEAEQDYLNTDTTNESSTLFDISSYEENVDNFQSSISALSDTLSSISDGSFSDSDLVDLLQEFPELEGQTDDLQSAIKNLVSTSLNELLDTLGESAPSELVDSLKGMAEEITNVSGGLDDMSSAVNSLDDITSAMSTLDSAYAQFIDNDEEIDLSSISSLQDAFGELDGWSDFLNTIGNSASTAEEVQNAFNNLTTEYINQSGVLDNLTFANAEFMASQLKAMGIANSEELVYSQLGVTAEQYAQIKVLCAQRGIDLANATYEEIQALIQESGVTEDTANAIYIFALKKALANENVLSTSADIANLQALVSALGGTTTALDAYNAAKNGNASQEELETMKNDALSEANEALSNATQQTSNLATTAKKVNYSGGADTASALSDNLSDVEDAAEDATNALQEAYDAANKLLSHREAMGEFDNDPVAYVQGLIDIYQNYAYDQETLWEMEEKIYETREKYLDEWIEKSQEVYDALQDMYSLYESERATGIELADGNVSSLYYKRYFKYFREQAEYYAEERSYLEQQLKDYLAAGGEKGDERWTELTVAIQEANAAIDETKLELKELVEEYTNNWVSAIKEAYSYQISVLEDYEDRLTKLYEITGDSKYQTEQLNNYDDMLSEYYKKKSLIEAQIKKGLKNGTLSTDEDDGNAYDQYVELLETLNDVDDAINDIIVDIKEFADTAIDDWITSIDELGDSAISLMEDYQSQLEAYISLLEANGDIVGAGIYEALISNTKNQISTLTTQLSTAKSQLSQGLANGLIVEGDENWEELVGIINETTEAITESQESLVEYNNALMELDWSMFDDLQEKLSSISDEISSVLDLIDDADVDMVNDDGSFSDDGLASIALNLQQRETGMYQLQKIKDEINQLNEDYANGTYDMSESEYQERLAELKEEQYDWIEKIQDAEGNVLEIYEEQQEAQIALIQDKIDALNAENDEYERALELQKAKYALEQALNNRNKMVFNGSEFEYTTDKDAIDDARGTLTDLELQNQISDLEDQIELLENTVLNLDDVIGEAIDEVNDRSSEVYEILLEYSEKYGISIDDYIISAWGDATDALTEFGETVTSESSKCTQNLQKVTTKIKEMYTSANTTAKAIVTMLNPSTTYIKTELSTISYQVATIKDNANLAYKAINSLNSLSLATLNKTTSTASTGVSAITTAGKAAKSALEALNSIDVYTSTGKTSKSVNALKEGVNGAKSVVEDLQQAVEDLNGLNVNSVASSIDGVKSAASGAASTVDKLSSALNSVPSNVTTTVTIKADSYGLLVNTQDGQYHSYGTWESLAACANQARIQQSNGYKAYIYAFKQGGDIADNGDLTLNQLAQSVGEDTMVAVRKGERILTQDQNADWKEWTEALPSLIQLVDPLKNLSSYTNNPTVSTPITQNSVSFTGDIVVQGVEDVNGLAKEVNMRFANALHQEMEKTK